MLHLAAILSGASAAGLPLHETSGTGGQSVLVNLGDWDAPACHEQHAVTLVLDDLLNGAELHHLCDDGSAGAQARAFTRTTLQPDGFTAEIDGWGEAIRTSDGSAFSMHHMHSAVEAAAHADVRLSVDWHMLVAGDALVAAGTAIDAFDRFLGEVGLSHTRLASALALHLEAADPAQQLARRKKLYDAAASLMGQSAGVTVSMMAIRPSSHPEYNFEQIAIRGYAQMRAAGSAMPIRLPMNAAFSDYRKVGGHEAARAPQHLIERFCTTPLPGIDSRTIKEAHLAHIINVEDIPTGEPFDCFASQHTHWNIGEPGKNKAIWLYIDYPTRRCIFDMYLHADTDRPNIVSADTHLWGTSLLAPPADLWMTQFTESVQFTALGPGIANADSSDHAKHRKLTDYMFNHHGWDPSEFVGYRCEIEVPVWRSGVCLTLDAK